MHSAQVTSEQDDHLVPLPGGGWALWSWVELRGTGFDASLVQGLAAPDLAAAADAYLDATESAARARTEARAVVAAAIRDRNPPDGHQEPGSNSDGAAATRAALLQLARRLRSHGSTPEQVGVSEVDAALARLCDALARRDCALQRLGPAADDAQSRSAAFLQRMAGDTAFREAITWQNRTVVGQVLDPAKAGSHSSSRLRKDAQLIASYLQRYCTKNDTIGFFGPVGWARLRRSGPLVTVAAGAHLVDWRSAHLEQWAVDALAAALWQEPDLASALAPLLAPRRFGFVAVEDDHAASALSGRTPLTAAQRRLLLACDGTRSAQALGREFGDGQQFPDAAAVAETLAAWRDAQLVAWQLEVPLRWAPEATLRSLLDQVPDDGIRRRAVSRLERIRQAVAALDRHAGDDIALGKALGALDAAFTEETGKEPRRNAGAMYAARSVAFQDCRRDLHCEFGPAFAAAIGPALTLVLQSARWLTAEVARRYRTAFAEVHALLASSRGSDTVPFLDAWFRMQRLLFGAKGRPLDAALAALQERWTGLLGLPREGRRLDYAAAALADRAAAAFDAPAPGWREARHHCPDLMLAAPGEQALRRGEFLAVLGEIHLGAITLGDATFVPRHPDAPQLFEAVRRDLGEGRVAFVPSKAWPKTTLRTTPMLVLPGDLAVETGLDPSARPRARTLLAADLAIVARGDQLWVTSRDGSFARELVDFMGAQLSNLVLSAFRLLPADAAHTPRITIDRLVVSRECWQVAASELDFAWAPVGVERFVACRAWANRLGLPRRVYVKAAHETKPVYIDRDSPVFVETLTRLVRRAAERADDDDAAQKLRFSEMLPGLEELWLPGPGGSLHTCELRIVARDPCAGPVSAAPSGAPAAVAAAVSGCR